MIKGSQKKKSSDHIKNEFLDSIVNIEKTDETGLNDVVRNAKDPKETVEKFEELLKRQNKLDVAIK